MQLQDEREKLQSLTTGILHEPCHDSNQKFHSSVEHQLQSHSDQSALLQERVKVLESELQEVKSTLKAERRNYEEKLSELDQQLSTSLSQVKQHKLNYNM